MKRVGDGDQGIKMNALTLLNVTIGCCEEEAKQRELVKLWSDAGLLEVLRVRTLLHSLTRRKK